jgi:hypothetical protein
LTIFTPANKQDIIIEFNPEKMARAVGSLATDGAYEGRPVSGVVVRKELRLVFRSESAVCYF